MSNTNYHIVSNALIEKPALLQAVLKNMQQQVDKDIAASSIRGDAIKLDVDKSIAKAEVQYQAALRKNAEYIFEKFESLPTEKKLDLIAQSEKVGELNAEIRKRAREQMQESLAKANAAYQEETYAKTDASAQQHAAQLQKTQTQKVVAAEHAQPDHDIKPSTQVAPSHDEAAGRLPRHDEPVKPAIQKQVASDDPEAINGVMQVTVNAPFKSIPFISSATPVLKLVLGQTNFDLGFQFKGVMGREKNADNSVDYSYSTNYAGIGIMNNRPNVIVSPLSTNVGSDNSCHGFGTYSTVMTNKIGGNGRTKFNIVTAGDCEYTSSAVEIAAQTTNSRAIAVVSGGYHYGANNTSVHIPAKYVPHFDELVKSLPSAEELGIINERINMANPATQVANVVVPIAEKVIAQAKPILSVVIDKVADVVSPVVENLRIVKLMHKLDEDLLSPQDRTFVIKHISNVMQSQPIENLHKIEAQASEQIK